MPGPVPDRPNDPLPAPSGRASFATSLSARLVGLTILFVLIAEILIYVPSIANFRNTWLNDRVAQARAAALIIDRSGPDALSRPLVEELLSGMQTTMIAIRIDQSRRLLAISDMPPMVDYEIDLRNPMISEQIMGAFDILLFGSDRSIRVVGSALGRGEFVEIVLSERYLRDALVKFSWSVIQLSLVICLIVALLVFSALNVLIGKPIKRLAGAVAQFRANPEDARSLLQPGQGQDELGQLERSLADMQGAIQLQLRQKEHLANLGLAVAKINHDLRNMLSSAQLMADRLGALPDQNVQRFVPRLLSSLDRAINFCQSIMAYGKAQERPAAFAAIKLHQLVQEIGEQFDLSATTSPAFVNAVPEALVVRADAEHLMRILVNLVRNARAALEASPDRTQGGSITVLAREITGSIEIDVVDTGPGIPEKVRATLFRAFAGSGQAGGTGLGLAIAQELLRAMGGSLALASPSEHVPGQQGDALTGGTVFRISLPHVTP